MTHGLAPVGEAHPPRQPLAWDDVQLAAKLFFGVEHQGELAAAQAVARRNVIAADEALDLAVEHAALD